MQAFWVEFHAREPGCVECDEGQTPDERAAAATALAEKLTGHKVISCKRLPHPADPRINKPVDPLIGRQVQSFCFRPQQCQGNTMCPHSFTCLGE